RDPVTPSDFFVVVNAGNRERDLAWMQQHAAGMDCDVADHSDELAMIALQGPASEAILDPLVSIDLSKLGYYKWAHGEACGIPASISRTGYTGEDGFELYFDANEAGRVFRELLEHGKPRQLEPIGLGARDTLRLEAGMALYGHELDDDTNPYEAGLGWAVKLGTGFIGETVLERVNADGPARNLLGLETTSKRVPRQGYEIVRDGAVIGKVASGTFSPVLDCNIATVFVDANTANVGDEVAFRVRDKDEPATLRALPFYKRT
ncbi:MAG: glycine cleavage system aminomethyltransferase GcvT, partial [Planctomycetes bacterium]|nr:glycine cleavage system aminomethyltransferase GcvT [Planctomycetota bacterium]